MKQSWEQENGEVQKLPRDATPRASSHPSQEPFVPVPPQEPTPVPEYFAPASTSAYVNKGKGPATRPSIVHEDNEDHNGYTYDELQTYPNGRNGHLSSQSTPTLSLDWRPTLYPSLRQQYSGGTPNGNLSPRPSLSTSRPLATQTGVIPSAKLRVVEEASKQDHGTKGNMRKVADH